MSAQKRATPSQADGLSRFERHFSSGEVLFTDGESASEALLLREGRVRVVQQIGGSERQLREVRPGQLLGESGLIADATRRGTAVALTDGYLLRLGRAKLPELFQESPELATEVVEQLALSLRDADDNLDLVTLQDHRSKVILALLRLVRRARASQPVGAESGPVELELGPLDLSRLVGLDVDAVKRVVRQLRDSGHVQTKEHSLDVTDVDSLRTLAGLLDLHDRIAGSRQRRSEAGGND